MSQAKAKKSSKKARLRAARLFAVQAVYQMDQNDQKAREVIQDFKDNRLSEPVQGEELIFPDGHIFTEIVNGVELRRNDIAAIIDTILRDKNEANLNNKTALDEPLFGAILMCGGYELMAHLDIDGPIIISDYIDVAHAFFDGRESKLVNGVLDKFFKAVRDNV